MIKCNNNVDFDENNHNNNKIILKIDDCVLLKF